MENALKALGFAGAEETALGATMVKTEYEHLTAAGEQQVIISTCCHTVNLLVQKHFPEVLPALAKVVSPHAGPLPGPEAAAPRVPHRVHRPPASPKRTRPRPYPGIVGLRAHL